jgi:hypothetical protein
MIRLAVGGYALYSSPYSIISRKVLIKQCIQYMYIYKKNTISTSTKQTHKTNRKICSTEHAHFTCLFVYVVYMTHVRNVPYYPGSNLAGML